MLGSTAFHPTYIKTTQGDHGLITQRILNIFVLLYEISFKGNGYREGRPTGGLNKVLRVWGRSSGFSPAVCQRLS
jgi:hypothetical protein